MSEKKYLDDNGLIYVWQKIKNKLSAKQDTLVSGTNIKTIGNQSILGSGNLEVGKVDDVTVNSVSVVTNKVAIITVPTKTSDLTNDSNFAVDSSYVHTDNNYTSTEKTKLSGIATGAQVNVIETVKQNGTALTITNKAVNVTVPTKTSDLTNDSNFAVDSSYVHTDNNYTSTEKTKLSGIATGAQVNVIETVKVNGTALTVTNKAVDVTVPTNNNQLTNGAGYITGISSSDVTTALGYTPISSAKIGAASGVASLDSDGKVPSSELPSYVDDVLEYDSLSEFPTTGESGKIYIALDTNLTYRWSGTQYTVISSSLALGETSSTAYRGDRGAAAYAHAVTNKGSAFSSGLYKITTNSEGHVTAATAVAKSDITGLGIPANDTNTTYTLTQDSSDGHKITLTPSTGTATTITIPDNNTTYSVATTSANGLMSSTDKIKMNKAVISSDTSVLNVISLTGDEYSALTSKEINTLYNITDDEVPFEITEITNEEIDNICT